MRRSSRLLAASFFLAAFAALNEGSAQAQFQFNPYAQYVRTQSAQNALFQQQINAANLGRVYGTNYGIPIYAADVSRFYGIPPVYPNFYNPGFVPPVAAPVVDPLLGSGVNPYSPGGVGGIGGANPYSPFGGGYNPYNPYNPYNYYNNPYYGSGAVLMGSADVMRSYGDVINSQEQARILREQALQAKLNTRKQQFDLEMYIKANTPTYTQEVEREMRNTLRRIQTNSLPGEVVNGKSLNFLLDDLRKFPNKKIALEPIPLSEGVLSHLNVTKNTFGVGVLRNDGRVTWPAALQERMTVNGRKDLESQIQNLVKEAQKGRLDANLLKDVRNEIDRMREDLVKKVNETPTAQYMDAKRFLQDFHEATVALERGEAPIQAEFQRYIEGGKTVQEVADYMIARGLRFAAAAAADEAAYRAVHSAMATYDIAMNTQAGMEKE